MGLKTIIQPLLPCVSPVMEDYASPEYLESINSIPSNITPFKVLSHGISKTVSVEQIARWGKEILKEECHGPKSSGYTGYRFFQPTTGVPAVVAMTILRNDGKISGWAFLAENGLVAVYVVSSLRRQGWGEKLYSSLPQPIDFDKVIFSCAKLRDGIEFWKHMRVPNKAKLHLDIAV